MCLHVKKPGAPREEKTPGAPLCGVLFFLSWVQSKVSPEAFLSFASNRSLLFLGHFFMPHSVLCEHTHRPLAGSRRSGRAGSHLIVAVRIHILWA